MVEVSEKVSKDGHRECTGARKMMMRGKIPAIPEGWILTQAARYSNLLAHDADSTLVILAGSGG